MKQCRLLCYCSERFGRVRIGMLILLSIGVLWLWLSVMVGSHRRSIYRPSMKGDMDAAQLNVTALPADGSGGNCLLCIRNTSGTSSAKNIRFMWDGQLLDIHPYDSLVSQPHDVEDLGPGMMEYRRVEFNPFVVKRIQSVTVMWTNDDGSTGKGHIKSP